MKRIFVGIITVLLSFILVACDGNDLSKLAPKYNKNDLVELSLAEKQEILDDIDLEGSMVETIEVLIKGSMHYSMTMELAENELFGDESGSIYKTEFNLEIDANLFISYSDDIDDFVIYGIVNKLEYVIKVTGGGEVDLNETVSISIVDTFVLIEKGHIYYQYDMKSTTGGKTTQENKKAKITDGFKEPFEELKYSIENGSYDFVIPEIPGVGDIIGEDSLDFNNMFFTDLEGIEVYKNRDRVVLKQQGSIGDALSTSILDEEMIGASLGNLEEAFKDFSNETLLEIKDNKMISLSSIQNGKVEDFDMNIMFMNIVLDMDVRNFGIVVKFDSSLPRLPNVSSFEEETGS